MSEQGYALLKKHAASKGSTEVEALCQSKFGLSLEDFHDTDYTDAEKVAFYKECLLLPVFGLAKMAKPAEAAADPASTNPDLMFGALKDALIKAGGDAHKRVAAHLREKTGRSVPLPVYHNDASVSAADKVEFYSQCLVALKTGGKLTGSLGNGDRKAEVEEVREVEEVKFVVAPVRRATTPVAPVEDDGGDDDEMREAMKVAQAAQAALAAIQARKTRPVSFDESACRRIVEDIVPKMIGHAMNNGQFPVKRVEDMIAAAMKVAGPSFDVDSVVKPRIDELLGSKLSDFLKRGPAAMAAAPKAVDEGKLASEVPAKDPTYVIAKEMRDLLRFIKTESKSSPQNVFATGPHGCGKTSLGYVLAAEFGMPVLVMDCANIREQRDWFGYKYTESGSVLWHRSQFDRCLSAGNHVIIIDEITRCTDQIRNVLNPLLDHRRRTFLQERGDYITVGPGTIIFVTANEGQAYTGCSVLDLALDDRLAIRLEVDYLPEDQEAKLLVARTGVDPDVAQRLAEIATTVRGKSVGFGATLSKTITTRQLIEAAKCYKGLGVDGLTPTIINHFGAEGGDQSERAQVLQMVIMKFPKAC